MPTQARKAAQDRTLQAVSQHMARIEVNGLPRNYELFYEAHCGTDVGLSREVMALPVSPNQTALDEIGIRYQLPGFVASGLPKSRNPDILLIASLREKMASGAEQKRGFSRALEAVAKSLREDNGAGPGDILAEIEYLSVSLSDAVVAETELEAALRSGANLLTVAEQDASSARAVMLRDRMTGLPNHAAFTEKLEALYADDNESRDTALFLVAVSDISDIADTYGEAAATRIVKKTAAIFRKTIKKDDFLARIGKAEFAFLFRHVGRDAIKPIANRLTASINDNLVFATSEGTPAIRLSMGASMATEAFSPQQLRQQAVLAAEASRAYPRTNVIIHGDTGRSGV
ncbi:MULTISPECIES: GGDEF domain-containing protein [Rhizobiaceae]|uniref:diguanylate cyclase n=1 Tax=Aliirhizobium cellulosilyticum TaxID=393664 RepID=A0A7W6THQ7_9HYPH|nr:GGDEF domain-containing protein [Rhizobium cellulosilyticum]MBB4350459.1 diguanylate cyclase (GGDEF)-like protein [Rhizobium cellulosilyticum]MBB4413509.1 diguanylate cyclase (GGDEF)-like protein [Rhizobium cellulosilyticum]MBB4448142.1 diguanylate cyclase (GGDEF)-like protein [Rhizobium cellulosilyticum]